MSLLDEAALTRLETDLEFNAEKMTRYILHTADYQRADRLFPAHYLVFGTNPLNIAYGASGPAIFLHEVLGELPQDIMDWMLKQPLSVDTYPPGLYLGLAGIAYTFQEIGLEEKAEAVMQMVYRSPYSFIPSLFEGLAGIGELMLDMFHVTGLEAYRHNAFDIADPSYGSRSTNRKVLLSQGGG